MLRVSTCLFSSLVLAGLTPHLQQEKHPPLETPQKQVAPANTKNTHKHSDWAEDEDPENHPADCSQPAIDETTTFSEQPFKHSDQLKPLDPRLWDHKSFDNKVLADHQTDRRWYRLPEWLAGTWHTDSETTLEEIDLRFGTRDILPYTIKHKESWIFGMQRDAQGSVWHFVMLPHLQQITKPDRSQYALVTKTSICSTRDSGLILKSQRISIEVERFTNIISSAHSKEIIEHLYPISPAKARMFLSVKTFDVDGAPIWMSRSVRTLRKLKGFSPMPQHEGQDLVALFKEFLNSADMGCLSGSQSK
ncbi:MAG: hypothetical protein HY711_03385 [Candidatus Melainabacteria bacterium]|nr:hypothetical protein [Candidatus Melainabacteria bacterium]